jgi:hypothetical protein
MDNPCGFRSTAPGTSIPHKNISLYRRVHLYTSQNEKYIQFCWISTSLLCSSLYKSNEPLTISGSNVELCATFAEITFSPTSIKVYKLWGL